MLSSNGRRVFIENKSSVTCYNFNVNTEQWQAYGANFKSGATKDGKVVKSTQNLNIGFSSNKGGNKVVSHDMGTNDIIIYEISLKTLIWKKIQTLSGLEQDVNSSGSYDFDFKGNNLVLYVTDHINDEGDIHYYAYNTTTKRFVLKFTIYNASEITNSNSIRTVKMNKNGTRFILSDTNGNEYSSVNSNGNGVVKVYDVNTTNYSYTLNATLSSTEDGGLYGSAIDINEAGNRIVISEPLERKHHVYNYVSSNWSVPAGYTLSSFNASSSRFNNTIAMNALGDAVFIGEYDENEVENGLVFGYYLDASNVWQNYETISGDFFDPNDANSMNQISDSFTFTSTPNFGSILSITSQGTKMLLGSADLTNPTNNNNVVLVKDVKAASKTLTDLGLTGSQIIKLQLTPKELINNSGLDVSNLRQLGVNASTILSGGKNESDLFNSGFGLTDIVNASSDLSGLIQDPSNNVKSIDLLASADVTTLLTKGISESNLLADISNSNDITNINFSQFKSANISATNLKSAGVDATTLKNSAYNATDLVGAGFNVTELKTAQLEAADLKGAGLGFNDLDGTYNTEELVLAEFDDNDFTNAGYTLEPSKAIDITVGNVTVNQEVKSVIKNTDISSLEIVLPSANIISETFALNPGLSNIVKINAVTNLGDNDISFVEEEHDFDISNGPLVTTFDFPNLDKTKSYSLCKYNEETGEFIDPQPPGYPVNLIYKNSINKYVATLTNLSMVAPKLHSTITASKNSSVKVWTVSPGYVEYKGSTSNPATTDSRSVKIHILTNQTWNDGNQRNKIDSSSKPNGEWTGSTTGIGTARKYLRVEQVRYDKYPDQEDYNQYGVATKIECYKTYSKREQKRAAIYEAIKYVALNDSSIPVPEGPDDSAITNPKSPWKWDIITLTIRPTQTWLKSRIRIIGGSYLRKNGSRKYQGLKHKNDYGWMSPSFYYIYDGTRTPPVVNNWYVEDLLNMLQRNGIYYTNNINDLTIYFETDKTLTTGDGRDGSNFIVQNGTIAPNLTNSGLVHNIVASVDRDVLNNTNYANVNIKIPIGTIACGSVFNNEEFSFSYVVDITPPTLTITSSDVIVDGFSNLQYVNLTFTLSEPIRDLFSSYFETTNSVLEQENITKENDTTYTGILEVTNLTIQTEVSIKLKINTIIDIAGNSNTEESNLFKYTYDGISPTIEISSNDITSNVDYYLQNAVLNFGISEPLLAFTINDINVDGNCTLDNFTKINETNYSVRITPNSFFQSSSFNVIIPANTLQDVNNNYNSSPSNVFTWNYDVSKPIMVIQTETRDIETGIKIESGSQSKNTFIDYIIKCNNKEIKTITLDSFTVTNATVSNLVQDVDNPLRYKIRLTPLSNLQTSIKVKAYGITDTTNNQNNLDSNIFYWTYSANNPIISIKSDDLNILAKSTSQSISVKIEISDPDINLLVSHFNVSGGTLSGFVKEFDYYVVSFSATNPRVLNQLSIAQDTVENADNDGNKESIFNWTWDKIPPTMVITSSDISSGSYYNGGINEAITLRFTPNEDVNNFTESDIILSNSYITNFEKVSGQIYYEATLRPNSSISNSASLLNKSLSVKVNKDTFEDVYNTLNNEDTNTFIWNYNPVSPTVTLTSNDMNSGEINNRTKIVITMTFSKDVKPFQLNNNIVVTNGFAQNLLKISDSVYSCDVYTDSYDNLNSESVLVITINIPETNTITDNYGNQLNESSEFVWVSNRVPIKEIEGSYAYNPSPGNFSSDTVLTLTKLQYSYGRFKYRFKVNKIKSGFDLNKDLFNITYDGLPFYIRNTSISTGSIWSPSLTLKAEAWIDEGKYTIVPGADGVPDTFSLSVSIPKYSLLDDYGNTNINTIGPFNLSHDKTNPSLSFEAFEISGNSSGNIINSGSITNDDQIILDIISSKPCKTGNANIDTSKIITNNCSFVKNNLSNGYWERQGWKSSSDRGITFRIIITPEAKNTPCEITINEGLLKDKRVPTLLSEAVTIPFIWTCDTEGPIITMSSSTIEGIGETTKIQDISINFSFDEAPHSGFTESDISYTNCEIISGTFSGSDKTYNVDVRSDVGGGIVSVFIPDNNTIFDIANNNSTSNSLSWNYLNISPSITQLISNDVSNNGFTKNIRNTIILTFDQEVVLTKSKLNSCLTGATVFGSIRDNLDSYGVNDNIPPSEFLVELEVDLAYGNEQLVTLSILPGVFYNNSDNVKTYNNESYEFKYTYYNLTPKLNITSTIPSGSTNNNNSIVLNFQDINKKPIYYFDSNDILLQPDSSLVYIDSFTANANNYEFSAVLHSSLDGQIRAIINPFKYKNIVDTENSESSSFTWNRDTSPVVFNIISTTIDNNSSSNDPNLNLIIKSNKIVSKQEIENNIIYTNVNPGQLIGTSPGKEFTFAATPILKNAQSNIYIQANSVVDEYGNTNPNDSDRFYWTFTGNNPTINLSSSTIPNGATSSLQEITMNLIINADETINFLESYISLTNGVIKSGTFVQNSANNYSFVFRATDRNINCKIEVNAGSFTDSFGVANFAPAPFNWIFDDSQPFITITANNLTSGSSYGNEFSTIDYTFTFSTDVSGFTESDISVTGGTLSNFRNQTSDLVWKVTLTPNITNGNIVLEVPAGAAQDKITNNNSAASNVFTIGYDITAPNISFSTTDVVQGSSNTVGEVIFNFTSDKDIATFDRSKVIHSNSSIGVRQLTLRTYRVTVKPSGGTASFGISEGFAIDNFGNKSAGTPANEIFTWTYDTTEVVLLLEENNNVLTDTSGIVTANRELNFTITSNDETALLELEDISYENLTISNFIQNNSDPTIYTLTTTSVNEGINKLFIPANVLEDGVGNPNVASNIISWSWDNTPPIVTISSPDVANGGLTNNQTIRLFFDTSEPILNFTKSLLSITNGSITNQSLQLISSNRYSGLLQANNGNVTVTTLPNKFTDLAGVNNVEGNVFSYVYDSTSPSVVLNCVTNGVSRGSYHNEVGISMELIVDDLSLNITESELNITNGIISNYAFNRNDFSKQVPEKIYSFDFISTNTVNDISESVVFVPENIISDAAGNLNTKSQEFNWVYDARPLSIVSISSTDVVLNGSTNKETIIIDFTVSERIFLLTSAIFITTNCSINSLNQLINDDKSYRLSVTASSPNSSCVIQFDSTQNLTTGLEISKQIGGSNLTFNWTFDNIPPTMRIISSTQQNNVISNLGSIDISFISSKETTNFTTDSISITGDASITNFSGSGKVYGGQLVPNSASTIIVSVNAISFSDTIGNFVETDTSYTWIYDNINPTVQISSNIASGSTSDDNYLDLSFIFSETIQENFVKNYESMVTITNATLSDVAGSGTQYSAKLNPLTPNAQASVIIPQNKFTDLAQNQNSNASNEFLWTYDGTALTLNMNSPNVINNGFHKNNSITVNVNTNSPITSSFTTSDITVTNGTVSNITNLDENTDQSWQFTLTSSNAGQVTTATIADSALQSNLNNNLASSFSWTYDNTKPTIQISGKKIDNSVVNSGDYNNEPYIYLDFVASENVTLLDTSINVTNGSLTSFAGSGTTYSAKLTPNANGAISTIIPVDSIFDVANNFNDQPSNNFIWNYDNVGPTLTIGSNDVSLNGSAGVDVSTVTIQITSNENITGLSLASFTQKNCVLSNLQGSDSSYSATVTTSDFTVNKNVEIFIPSNKVTDIAGNTNDSVSNTFTFTISAEVVRQLPPSDIKDLFDNDADISENERLSESQLNIALSVEVPDDDNAEIPLQETYMNTNTNRKVFNLLLDQIFERSVRKRKRSRLRRSKMPLKARALEVIKNRTMMIVAKSNQTVEFNDLATNTANEAVYVPLGQVNDFIEIKLNTNEDFKITQTSSNVYKLEKPNGVQQIFDLNTNPNDDSFTYLGYTFVFGSLTVTYDAPAVISDDVAASFVPCFMEGTQILTTSGYINIENIIPQKHVLIDDHNNKLECLDVKRYIKPYNGIDYPHVVPKGSCLSNKYVCTQDLYLTHNHAIYLPHMNQYYPSMRLKMPKDKTKVDYYVYYHIFTENFFTDVVIANGIPCETNGKFVLEKIKSLDNTGKLMKSIIDKCDWVQHGPRKRLTEREFKALTKKYMKKKNKKGNKRRK